MEAATSAASSRGGVTQYQGSTPGEKGGVREKPLPPHAQLMSALNPDRKYLK